MSIGGIETLILDICSELGDKILLISPKGELDSIPTKSKRIFDLNICSKIRIVKNSKNIPVLISFDPLSSFYALNIFVNNNFLNYYSGIFHPKAYFFDGRKNIINKFLLKCISSDFIFFMSLEMYQSHKSFFKLNLNQNNIYPLPYQRRVQYNRNFEYNKKKLRILSIGRYDDFKKYTYGSINIVKSLLKNGIHVQWDFFGHGNTKEDLIKMCFSNNLENYISFNNSINYSELSKYINNYDIFIGMGKSALEIASTGMPVICAISYEENLTHGYLSDLPVGNLGEKINNFPVFSIEYLLSNYLNLSDYEREQLINKIKMYVNTSYPSVTKYMENFKNINDLKQLKQLKQFKLFILLFIYNLCFLNKYITKFKMILKNLYFKIRKVLNLSN
jgi:hypothetical protein